MIDTYIDDILKEETLRLNSVDYHSDENLSCNEIHNGILLPYKGEMNGKTSGGVVDSDGIYVDLSGLHENHGCGYSVDSKDIVRKEKNAIYLGVWFPIWGHCITDNIKKLWFLKTPEAKRLINDGADLVYIVMMNDRFTLPQSFVDLLCCLNIEITQLKQILVPTQYQSIYIPDNSLFRKGEKIFYTKEFLETRNDILANLPKCKIPTYDKIYFSRSRLKNGKQDFGEKRIEDIFRYLGYKIIYPEKKTFAEQVALLQGCSHFAATEGSTSHNSLFCKPHTEVCIIRKAGYVNDYQTTINHVNKQNVTYIDSHLSICADKNRVWNGPFFLYVNSHLCDFADLPYDCNSFSLAEFGKYVNAILPKIEKNAFEVSDFYAKKLVYEMNRTIFCKNVLKRFLHKVFFSLPIQWIVFVNRCIRHKK